MARRDRERALKFDIYDYLISSGGDKTPQDVAKALDERPNAVNWTMGDMLRKNNVKRERRGKAYYYTATSRPKLLQKNRFVYVPTEPEKVIAGIKEWQADCGFWACMGYQLTTGE